MFVTTISQCLALWNVESGAGAEALLRCAVDAAALTMEGVPWSIRSLCVRYVTLRGGTENAVRLSMERALMNAGSRLTVGRAIWILVGHALRDHLGIPRKNV